VYETIISLALVSFTLMKNHLGAKIEFLIGQNN